MEHFRKLSKTLGDELVLMKIYKIAGPKMVNYFWRRWQEYVERLYLENNLPKNILEGKTEVDRKDKDDLILRSKFDSVPQCLKHGKAVGIDGIHQRYYSILEK